MPHPLSRRAFLEGLAAGSTVLAASPARATGPSEVLTKPIPSTGERIPVVGMGTWITFNVGDDPVLRAERTAVARAFFEAGGAMIDSSPMYGSSQAVVGHALRQLDAHEAVFSADKIWTSDGTETTAQLGEIAKAWGVPSFDLMQVHNLLAWEQHLPKLLQVKEQGRVRYVGVTTSHGRRHGELARILKSQPLDFVQLTYDPTHRAAEDRLLPLARDHGIAVIVNRPYDGGRLIDTLQRGHEVPPWAREAGIDDWPQFVLRWIVAHPAVTVAIPATTKVAHVRENLAAARGPLPDPTLREKMRAHLEAL